MKTFPVFYFLLCTILLVLPVYANENPISEGKELPGIVLSIPDDKVHKDYLGLTGKGTFKIPQIKARIVTIVVFSMYCPHCQREAPTLNAFYNRLENDPKLKGKAKIIGIGAGNSRYEVDLFKKTYNIPYPLFPDGKFVIHKDIGEVRTPYFIGIQINNDGTHQIFYSKLGGEKGAQYFLDKLIEKSGLQ